MTHTTNVMLGAWKWPPLFLLTSIICISKKTTQALGLLTWEHLKVPKHLSVLQQGLCERSLFLSWYWSINHEICCTHNPSRNLYPHIHLPTRRCCQQTWLCWRRFHFLNGQGYQWGFTHQVSTITVSYNINTFYRLDLCLLLMKNQFWYVYSFLVLISLILFLWCIFITRAPVRCPLFFWWVHGFNCTCIIRIYCCLCCCYYRLCFHWWLLPQERKSLVLSFHKEQQ